LTARLQLINDVIQMNTVLCLKFQHGQWGDSEHHTGQKVSEEWIKFKLQEDSLFVGRPKWA